MIDLFKNVNLLTAGLWIVAWNVLCGIGLYFDGYGPIETLPGSLAMVVASLFAFITSLLGLFTAGGRRRVTASYGDYEKIKPTLRVLALASGFLTLAGAYQTFNIATGQA
ncbi:hypothetical protein [Agrilutibacter solisilvae]|uniref:Uncharacterized protein n=1 Tax=Agrilutibacter solisilvae TaxID=2763317 RepID=A0A975ATF1_9GAMM|nr:hypothetical protein [Lysobacter solisilvae]QSX78940.1 hypothetical protein I8J32_003165 [Lysobacter solisilvae]